MGRWLLDKEILASRASAMLAAMGEAQQMQQGASGKADFLNGELDFFPSP